MWNPQQSSQLSQGNSHEEREFLPEKLSHLLPFTKDIKLSVFFIVTQEREGEQRRTQRLKYTRIS